MLPSATHWPNVTNASLGSMTVQYDAILHNHLANHVSGVSPVDVITNSRWQQHKFHCFHFCGCPVYVVDKMIANGG